MDHWILAIASPTVAAVIVKWLLSGYDKRGHQLEKERREQIASEILQLKKIVGTHAEAMIKIRDALSKMDKDLAVLIEKLKFQSHDVDKLMKAFQGFVESSVKRFSEVETKISEISKDVFRVSTKKRSE